MKILVTGAAGFIGSHLCERLLQDERVEVIGLDAFVPSASPIWMRERNLHALLRHPRFTLVKIDLRTVSWDQLLPNVDIVFHLAGMPGVRSSWGEDFKTYIAHNIAATQRLLEGCKRYSIRKFIYASTSSVYGQKTGPVVESAVVEPLSPYGVSKLTGEHLCKVYAYNEQLPLVILRFFTVYGPRQRTDMAFHRFIRRMLENKPIPLYGDGRQSRDFTYIADCVDAVARAAYADGLIGETINIGGKERASVLECISIIEELFGRKADLQKVGDIYGEPKQTWADIGKAQSLLGYQPQTDLRTGLEAEYRFLRDLYRVQ
ncbi:NAD-dependent epimerase/dehydratase family protein [Paenibacillus validus]|uniref:NAD-dependent epimerase/dehydratase family protein n=1 Tax=Paenibacillus validus TaxID=44253 RepID=A0A7X2Z7F0_9BACL|nr:MULTISPECIES: NAD-dependent epimerase/dehydratase family protein [Paenibacillus]MED4602260.1 NAD-dependent epimerase/dehydratase family protein [Paenibacillus validus]MED4607206.1 NAD-dependent epimerase/dehydratase family protein [Paenibacillus validus]MUG69053.1 NAD-dependent epimerase/dehydratase family protein [Paenibacillus validus]